MDDDFIRDQIERAAPLQWASVITHILAASWPGGMADHTEPMAMRWVRKWRPAGATPALPACSCGGGRCALCN